MNKNMDSFNINSDNVVNLEDRPLKRPKCSELMDSEFDTDVNVNFASPPSPSIQTDLGIVMDSNIQSLEEEKSANEHMFDNNHPEEIEEQLKMSKHMTNFHKIIQ